MRRAGLRPRGLGQALHVLIEGGASHQPPLMLEARRDQRASLGFPVIFLCSGAMRPKALRNTRLLGVRRKKAGSAKDPSLRPGSE
jgi:hypothetical protein